ncbi:response regulator [Gracilibacillus kekensis]|uniref:Two-component system, response regulator YesN n=1 Tax=Gracilibacillus kekensis TaxID=1027249 RepID=A0A1M7N8Y0_9BACI|nr:response regulator [Gracilibacillus kekensis]SHN00043.1 two-component system, response regulator YesN [Gracilibacillus kekensis]
MYKVMLVDDDYPTIEFLTEAIDWESLGFKLISTHENGLQALEFAKQNTPDILITDIGMPKMDGIELTREIKKLKDSIQVAIISCHNEFSYAQQALKLDVQDYILKESLDPEDLQKILLTCKKRLDNDTTKVIEVKKLQHKIKVNHDIEHQKLLRQYIQGSSNKFLDLFTQANYSIPVYFYINEYYKVKKNFISSDTLQFAVQNIMQEIIDNQESQQSYCIHYENNKGFVFYQHSFTIKHDVYGTLKQLLRKLQEALNRYLSIDISFVVGQQVDNIAIKDSIHSLINSDEQIFYANKNIIMKKSEELSSYQGQEMFDYYQDVANQLKQTIFERDIKSFTNHLDNWIHFCVSKQYSSKIVKEWFLRMVLDLKMRLRTIPSLQSNYYVESLQEEVFLLNTIYELRNWLIEYAQKCLAETNQQLKDKYHKDVLSACYYVSHNLEKKLSLDEVADYLYLNASYFSRLFKKEMQITFVEYVKQRKVERAKELLEITNDSVGSICEQLGYDNQSYFIKVFKKIVGYTPLEYRGKQINGVFAK